MTFVFVIIKALKIQQEYVKLALRLILLNKLYAFLVLPIARIAQMLNLVINARLIIQEMPVRYVRQVTS